MPTERFDDEHADAGRHQVQAWSEIGSRDGRARALVLAYARRDAEHPGRILVGVRLVAVRLEGGRERAGANWTVSLDARSAVARCLGAEHSHYISSQAPGESRRRAFRSDGTGGLAWFQCPEPGSGDNRGYPCNWSPRMETTTDALGLTEDDREVSLALVLTGVESRSAVHLSGITIRVPDRIWYERRPRAGFTGWLAKLGLLERFSVWRALVRSLRYRRFVAQRGRAMRKFAAGRGRGSAVGEEAAPGGTSRIR